MTARSAWKRWVDGVEAVTPRWVDSALWAATHVDDFVYALITGVWASIRHPEDPIYAELPRVLDGRSARRTRRLDRAGRYLVVSDHHLLYSSSPHDYFGGHGRGYVFRNERIYAEMLRRYADDGYTLIENGDVEDLVVTEPVHDRLNCLLSGAAGRFVLGWDGQMRGLMRRRRLMRIVGTYQAYYALLLSTFGADRIVKLVGNHDVELLDPEYAREVPLTAAGVEVHEFAVIPATGDAPAVVVCHGHQMDPWTCAATANRVGESITESFAWAGQGADRIWLRDDWGPPLAHDNRPVRAPSFGPSRGLTPKMRHMGERRLLRKLAAAFDGPASGAPGPARPWLVLGHTHEPRLRPTDRYVNSAAAGRYQDLVWAVEIDGGVPSLVGWWVEDRDGAEVLVRGVLEPEGPDSERIVCRARADVGPLPALPYLPRRSLAEIDVEVNAAIPEPNTPAWWVVWRVGVHLALYGGVVAAPILAWWAL